MGTALSSSFTDILSACKDQQVTGVLRVRDSSEPTEAEIHFLSGVQDSVRLGPVKGDEAMARISLMTNPEFSAMATLPPMSESSQQPFPKSGSLGDFRPVDLMRYCEVRCLTCSLYLNCADRQVKVNYELGDLQSVEPEPDLTISVLEAIEGTYRFELPAFDLPDMTAPRTFSTEGMLPEQPALAANNVAENATAAPAENDSESSSKPEIRFSSIAAPAPDSSIALDDTLLDATIPRSAANTSQAAATAILQAPPARQPDDIDVFASLSPELLEQVLGEPQSGSRRTFGLPDTYLYPAAAFIACVGLALLAYAVFAPITPASAEPPAVQSQ